MGGWLNYFSVMGLADLLQPKLKSKSLIHQELTQICKDLTRVSPQIKIFVFGSVARGQALETSDYDIAVILSESLNKAQFKKDFYSQRSRINTPVDFIFRSEKEFEKNQFDSAIDQVILSEGVEIYPTWNLHD